MSSWLAAAFSDWLRVRVIVATSCPSRDDPLNEYSMLFPNKLNTHDFLFCVMKKHWYATLAINLSLLQQPSQTRHDRPKINRFYVREIDSSKSARSRHYYLAKSARSRHYHLASEWTIARYIYIANQYPQSIVRSRECCREKWTLFSTSSLGDEVVNNLGLI